MRSLMLDCVLQKQVKLEKGMEVEEDYSILRQVGKGT